MDARNDLKAPLTKLCLALETARRTDEHARVAGSQEFLAFFFPHDESAATDRLFCHLPKDVRGPLLTSWGIRGKKSALRDSDNKVQAVVHDALLSGDIDHVAVEQAITPELLIKWVPLSDWWSFWRSGKLDKRVLHYALTLAYDQGQFDAPWLLGALQVGEQTGIEALACFLSKDDLTRWLKGIHASGDGSPAGMLSAIGWSTVIEKTDMNVLLAVLDAFAVRQSLSLSSLAAPPPPTTERRLDTEQLVVPPRKARESQRELSRKPEPSRPPDASLKPGSRASVRPPAIPIDVEEPTEGTDEYQMDTVARMKT
jgi:hypothetical protein